MTHDRIATSIDVWESPDCATAWSVSLSDEDGEIRCLGGDDDRDAAYAMACGAAEKHSLPARLLGASGQVSREYSALRKADR